MNRCANVQDVISMVQAAGAAYDKNDINKAKSSYLQINIHKRSSGDCSPRAFLCVIVHRKAEMTEM